MIRRFLNRLAARRLSAVAHEQREGARERIRATARQICAELGQPIPEILK